MTDLDIAKLYFELSNKNSLKDIENLFTDSTIYKSQTTGEYIGKVEIMEMQSAFRNKFSSLEWKVNSVEEVKPGVILFDYDFTGKLTTGHEVSSSGLEYITVDNGMISQVEIQNKS